jgi:signal transduction histidine kinase
MIRIGEKAITFKLDIHEDLPAKLFGDDLRIKQILNNLLKLLDKVIKQWFVIDNNKK